MTHQLRRLALALLAGFCLIALTSGYWGYVRRDTLTARPDNPRRVLAERRVPRGTIYDRHGEVLAESVGGPGNYARHYPYPDLAPVLGYVSAFYGSAGVEAAADPVLHGDEGVDPLQLWWASLLGAPSPGRGVRLSIDLRLQVEADALLGDRVGVVILLDAATGEILALASHPTYDPNRLDENWESLINNTGAPLLNRATFALYQPGGAMQPFLLTAALRSGDIDVHAPLPNAASQLQVNGQTLGCHRDPGRVRLTLVEALTFGCPRPFATLGQRLGAHALEQLFNDLRFFEAPSIAIPTLAATPPGDEMDSVLVAIGQGPVTVTPLHLALAAAALARDGEVPVPQLVLATQGPDSAWQSPAPLSHPIAAFGPDEADQVKALLPDGHSAIALTGAEGQRLAWFTGFAPFDDSRYAIAVLLEDGDVMRAEQIGRALLKSATHLSP